VKKRVLIPIALLAISIACEDRARTPKPHLTTNPSSQRAEARCEDQLEWCSLPAVRVPTALQRRLRLPEDGRRGCQATPGRQLKASDFGGVALGKGPVRPLVAPANLRATNAAKKGTLVFYRSPEHPGWFELKTLWFSVPSYRGPVWIRARRVEGHGVIRFGEAPELEDPLLSAGSTVNGTRGYREWPGATWIKRGGCYMWQIDGTDFSQLVLFRAALG
jgi:hypothetical protein